MTFYNHDKNRVFRYYIEMKKKEKTGFSYEYIRSLATRDATGIRRAYQRMHVSRRVNRSAQFFARREVRAFNGDGPSEMDASPEASG